MLAYFFFKCKIREAPGYVQWFPGLFCCFKKIFNSHDSSRCLHPGRSTWNLRITHFKKEHHLPAIMFHRFQPFIFQGVFASFLDDDVHPYQKDLLVSDADGEKKHPKKSHPQSARNLTPPVSELRFIPGLPGDRCFKCPSGGFCNSTHHPPIARPGGTWPDNLMVLKFSPNKNRG